MKEQITTSNDERSEHILIKEKERANVEAYYYAAETES